MQSHRLARLLRIIVEVRSHPKKTPARIAEELHVSLRHFYRDRNKLADMGFRFERINGRFTILHDPVVTITDLPLSEMLAMVLLVRQSFAAKDFMLVRRALDCLNLLVDHMQEAIREFFKTLIHDVIVKDGFGCEPGLLEDLTRAVDEKQRILVHFYSTIRKSPAALDPYGFCFKKSKLFLDAYSVEQKKQKKYEISTMEKVVFTPFYRPEDALPRVS